MKKTLLASLVTLTSFAACANEYQSISNASYADNDYDEIVSIGSIYYFDARKALGPYNEFSYINTKSNIGASYSDNEFANTIGVRGEYFFNNFVAGASYNNADSDWGDVDYYEASFGYLFTPDIIARIHYRDSDARGIDGSFYATAQYNLSLNTTDYVGFTASVDEEFDFFSLDTKYYAELGQGRYLTVNLDIDAGDFDHWLLGSNYYFNKGLSVFASVNKSDDIQVGGRYYFNSNWALSGSYGTNLDNDLDYDMYQINLTAQF
ncbi:putative porin [Pseudoalteromonas spongiae]|uniref:Porin n=1 Tax=Pseudoalteromonas spongiae TaxID=298657 RepID=A0ABU8ERS5_9GAMM